MPRPNQTLEKRRELLPVVCQAFSELGYRRATTAEIAERCGVQENILYRLWRDKKEMYLASVHFVYDNAVRIWTEQATQAGSRFCVSDVLEYEAEHLGEFGHYRILFAGLSETDDAEIRSALAKIYRDFHRFIRCRIEEARGDGCGSEGLDAALAAWTFIGLGTVLTFGKEMNLMGPRVRKQILKDVGDLLLGA